MPENECVVCGTRPQMYQAGLDWNVYECPRCGRFRIKPMAEMELGGPLRADVLKRMALSHLIRRINQTNEFAEIKRRDVPSFLARAVLPSAAEQVDNVLRWMAAKHPLPGERFTINGRLALEALVGAASESGLNMVLNHMSSDGLVDQHTRDRWSITFKGWERVEELRKGRSSGTYAFMAMAFGQEPLTTLVNDHFRTAVEQTGFPLKRVDDEPRAGLIDDWLRVDIRGCRFLVADLTHHNNGAYWEAGYAEGLGKPVIYTCERSVFEDSTRGTHFDTNHHLTVVWEEDAREAAATLLKATIRASVPDAKQSDD